MQQAEQSAETKIKSALNARLEDIIIDSNNPFAEDLLKRRPYAEILTNVLSIYTHGAVIALNGKWGTGKTTFVKKWQKMLEQEQYGFTTIYFNAWQSDYVDDPLIPLIANLNQCKHIDEKQEKEFAKVINAGFKIMMGTAIGLGKGLIKTVGNDILTSGIDALGNEINALFKQQVDESEKQTSNMEEFKKALKGYVRYLDSKQPLIYFVDELDRCNPTFAVKVLERIKHLFEIEDIIFILSIDKEQLENSIKGYFGSGIDAEEYLHRFIDISYNLPQPELKDFCGHLYDYYNLMSFFNQREKKTSFRDENILFLNSAEHICTFKRITLRQLDRIFALTAIALKGFISTQFLFPDLFFFLTYLKVCHPDLFDDISSIRLSMQQLINSIEGIIPKQMFSDDGNISAAFDMIFAKLLVTYSNDEQSDDLETFVKNPMFDVLTVSKIDKNKLIHNITYFQTQSGYHCPITHLTNKINLLDSFMN